MSEVFATLSTSLNQRAPADIPLERKSPDLHGAGIFRRPAVFDYSWTTRDASASSRLQGTLPRESSSSALLGAVVRLLPTLGWRYRFTAAIEALVDPSGPYLQGFQDAGPHPHAQGAGEATTCGVQLRAVADICDCGKRGTLKRAGELMRGKQPIDVILDARLACASKHKKHAAIARSRGSACRVGPDLFGKRPDSGTMRTVWIGQSLPTVIVSRPLIRVSPAAASRSD